MVNIKVTCDQNDCDSWFYLCDEIDYLDDLVKEEGWTTENNGNHKCDKHKEEI